MPRRSPPANAGKNIGIACGPAGLLVVDLDQPRPSVAVGDGRLRGPGEWAANVEDDAGLLATLARGADSPHPRDTYTVSTPRGEHR